MKKILLLGAGKSSAHLMRYLSENSQNLNIEFLIADIRIDTIPAPILNYPQVKSIQLLRGDIMEYESLISQSYLTISMLPAFMHIDVAKLCLKYSVHLITPSYINPAMKDLDAEVRAKDLIFLNEMGFDPGIDHMTTMKIYHEITANGGKLSSYKSYAGGLVAVKNDNNPWRYKFSWNPRNVILAGQGGDILYKENNLTKTLTYHQLFAEAENITLSNAQSFDAYANRDSLKYENLYNWSEVKTLLRGTLRHRGFCQAWNILVSLGLTDDIKQIENIKGKTYREFYELFLNESPEHFLTNQIENIQDKLSYIGFEDGESLIEKNGTAAEILQSILEKKWRLEPNDTDRVVMVHLFEYENKGKYYRWESYLDLEGENNIYTAMSKTVGMPIAFAVELILQNRVSQRGVLMPTNKEIYQPIIDKLETIGIVFRETQHHI